MIIHPYKLGSRSCKRLKEALKARSVPCFVLRRQPKTASALVVNWGASEFEYPYLEGNIVNDPFETYRMSNKVKFFEATQHDPRVLAWTTNPDEAREWGTKVFCRTLVEASGGRGIVVYDPERQASEPLPKASLYTKYQPKTHEYRVHFARSLRGKEFFPLLVQRKVFVKTEARPAPTDWQIRSHDNGFIFQSYQSVEDMKIPREVINTGRGVMAEYFPDLHFAALDIMMHDKKKTVHVIEGNTAPGLENNTVEIYADYFSALTKEHRNVS
jgi:hypothetical protein